MKREVVLSRFLCPQRLLPAQNPDRVHRGSLWDRYLCHPVIGQCQWVQGWMRARQTGAGSKGDDSPTAIRNIDDIPPWREYRQYENFDEKGGELHAGSQRTPGRPLFRTRRGVVISHSEVWAPASRFVWTLAPILLTAKMTRAPAHLPQCQPTLRRERGVRI